jgi:hypothetical protein
MTSKWAISCRLLTEPNHVAFEPWHCLQGSPAPPAASSHRPLLPCSAPDSLEAVQCLMRTADPGTYIILPGLVIGFFPRHHGRGRESHSAQARKIKRRSPWKSTVGLPGSSGEWSLLPSLGLKLLSEAHASIKVPSTVKCFAHQPQILCLCTNRAAIWRRSRGPRRWPPRFKGRLQSARPGWAKASRSLSPAGHRSR